MQYKIGIDLGGTKIEGIVLDENFRECFRKRIASEREKGYEHILNNIKLLYDELCTHTNGHQHTFGIGTPGAISAKSGLMKNSNTTCLNGRPFHTDLEKKLGRKIAIENDANCFAMAESLLGMGKGKDMTFGVIMGTGCGGGLVYKGNLISGLQKIAGEWGHATINPKNGPTCYCGKKGCIETYISGHGVENLYEAYTGTRRPFAEVISLYRNGDNKASDIVNQFFEHFGIAISNLINTLDPDIIVVGGGLSNIDELYTIGVEQVRKYVFNDSLETPIVKNMLGDSAGVLGAALIGI
ncbi:MAG: ROK family protein [Cytophagaceae bacterium]|nr:ROK family protein [Cytophagaceae bacterium]MDW8456662.1 ROK family protein [Cytophagaceae bacterium]